MNVSKIAKRGLLYTQTGTPYYASPEVWNDKPYDSKSDIWSMGCVIYEMAALKPPFRAEDMDGLYKKVTEGVFKKLPSHFSVDLNNLVYSMLKVKPNHRPSAAKLLESPLIQKRLDMMHILTDPSEVDDHNPELLKTIKLPNNLHYLTDLLPVANYEPIKINPIKDNNYKSMMPGVNKSNDKSFVSSKNRTKFIQEMNKRKKSIEKKMSLLPQIKAKSMRKVNGKTSRKASAALIQDLSPRRKAPAAGARIIGEPQQGALSGVGKVHNSQVLVRVTPSAQRPEKSRLVSASNPHIKPKAALPKSLDKEKQEFLNLQHSKIEAQLKRYNRILRDQRDRKKGLRQSRKKVNDDIRRDRSSNLNLSLKPRRLGGGGGAAESRNDKISMILNGAPRMKIFGKAIGHKSVVMRNKNVMKLKPVKGSPYTNSNKRKQKKKHKLPRLVADGIRLRK